MTAPFVGLLQVVKAVVLRKYFLSCKEKPCLERRKTSAPNPNAHTQEPNKNALLKVRRCQVKTYSNPNKEQDRRSLSHFVTRLLMDRIFEHSDPPNLERNVGKTCT